MLVDWPTSSMAHASNEADSGSFGEKRIGGEKRGSMGLWPPFPNVCAENSSKHETMWRWAVRPQKRETLLRSVRRRSTHEQRTLLSVSLPTARAQQQPGCNLPGGYSVCEKHPIRKLAGSVTAARVKVGSQRAYGLKRWVPREGKGNQSS